MSFLDIYIYIFDNFYIMAEFKYNRLLLMESQIQGSSLGATEYKCIVSLCFLCIQSWYMYNLF